MSIREKLLKDNSCNYNFSAMWGIRLNLVNLEKKDIALKVTWPQILSSELEYASLVYDQMRCKLLQENILRCRIQPEDVKLLGIRNKFWRDALRSWNTFNSYYNFTIENQLTWYNSSIRIGGKPFLWGDVQRNGLLYVHQLFENCEFITSQQAKGKYRLTEMRFNSLKAAIPQDWRSFFQTIPKEVFSPIPPHNYDSCIVGAVSNISRKVYQYIQEDAMLLHSKYIKWMLEIGPTFSESLYDFGKDHMDIYRITNIPKYRSFQYRIMEHGLVTRVQLCKWNTVPTLNCALCNKDPETITHLFWNCSIVQKLWEEVREYINKRFNQSGKLTVILDVKRVILNRVVERKQHVANFVCLLTKYYIYSQKCLQKPISFQGLRRQIKSVENIEKYIATKNGKLNVHNRKWVSVTGTVQRNSNLTQYTYEYIQKMWIMFEARYSRFCCIGHLRVY